MVVPEHPDDAALTAGGLDVLVVGAGPVGLVLALQARRCGARVRVVERRTRMQRPSRAMLLWPRTLAGLATLDMTGKLSAHPSARLRVLLHLGRRQVPVDLSRLTVPGSARPPLMVRQADLEAILLEEAVTAGIPLATGATLTGLQPTSHGARAVLTGRAGSEEVTARFVVGADGAHSTVRLLAGIGWHGRTYPQETVLADLDIPGLAATAAHVGAGSAGVGFLFPAGEHGATWRLVVTRTSEGSTEPPGQDGPAVPVRDIEAALRGANLPDQVGPVRWSTRVRLQRRRATHLRAGPFFVVGDAAHVVSPAGAQGLNTGLQDALNLGWKLAMAARRLPTHDVEPLLGSYEAERLPVAAQVGHLTGLLLLAEGDPSPLPAALRTAVLPAVAPLVPLALRLRPLTAAAGLVLSQSWVSYAGSPLTEGRHTGRPRGVRLGHPAPDVSVVSHGSETGLHDLLTEPAVRVLTAPGVLSMVLAGFPDVRAHNVLGWAEGDVVGVRPDGYVGYRDHTGQAEPLRRWLSTVTGRAVGHGARPC
jgi:2-polyprenyl-6-methoxyphenol hydroxylase-like FAD-dependent oxidoreductase